MNAPLIKQPKLCEAGSSTSDSTEYVEWWLKVCMNPEYQTEDFVSKFRTHWDDRQAIEEKQFQLYNTPFSLCTMKDFVLDSDKESLIYNLIQEMCGIDYDRRQMDLYEFYQTNDLITSNRDALFGFYTYLEKTVMPWMSQLTGLKLTDISASVSMYNAGDYLLVHDDLMTDRRIAFVYYISPWEGAKKWTPEMGGALELFNNIDGEPFLPVTIKIPPQNNQFIFFKVCHDSFHQVGEVTNFDYPRLTINGWFHGPATEDFVPKIPSLDITFVDPISGLDEGTLQDLVNPIYLKNEYKEDIQKQIEDNSEASLEDFLDEDFYDQILTQIQIIPNTCWKTQGPANLCNYEILQEKDLPDIIKKFCDMFKSHSFFKLLHEYTELDIHGIEAQQPKCSLELQRWTQGSYTVLGDPSKYADSTLDLIFYINAYPHVGTVSYISPEEKGPKNEIKFYYEDEEWEEEEEEPVLLTIMPKDNALNIVYRSEGTTRFTKYVSKMCLKEGKYSYILACRYKE